MSTMREIGWEACLLESRPDPALVRLARQRLGYVPGAVGYYAAVPWTVSAQIDLIEASYVTVTIDRQLADLITLVVSQDNSCRYCFAAQRVLLRMMGVPGSRIDAIERGHATADLGERERRALEFARRVSRSNPLPTPADRRALDRVGLSDLAAKEIAAYAALYVYFNRASTLPALPPQGMEAYETSWSLRFLGPLFARRFRRRRRRIAVTPTSSATPAGPFAELVAGLDGLPAAAALRDALDAAWRSEILPARTKGLVFAVIARGLGCPASERESIRLLDAAGMSRDEIDAVLAHLAAPTLSPVERAAAPFARETIRYQPAQIQQRAQAVRDALTREEFIELITVAALANAVCRLGVVLDGS